MFESVPLCSRPTVGVLCLSSAVLVLICARISLRSIANDVNRGRFRSTIRSRCDGRARARFSTSARVERPFRRRCDRCRCCDAVRVVLDWMGCESTLSIFGFSDSRCFLCRLGSRRSFSQTCPGLGVFHVDPIDVLGGPSASREQSIEAKIAESRNKREIGRVVVCISSAR